MTELHNSPSNIPWLTLRPLVAAVMDTDSTAPFLRGTSNWAAAIAKAVIAAYTSPESDAGMPTSGHKLNADQTVAVATDVYFNPDMSTAPRGVKLQLIGEGGVAVYGTYNGDPFWREWCPVPKRRKAP